MATYTGTHDISWLLATRYPITTPTDWDEVVNVLQRDNAAHNAIIEDMLDDLVEFTTDKTRPYGDVGSEGEMIEVDEYGRGPTQRPPAAPGTVGFPLRRFQFPIGWTDLYLELATGSELAVTQQKAQRSHIRTLNRDIKRALFQSANYTFNDFLVDKQNIAVKRLINADSSAIPTGPNAESFDGATHTHYNGSATLTAAAVQANIDDVIEHGFGSRIMTVISRTDETAFRALTGFIPLQYPYLGNFATTTGVVTTPALDMTRMDNRQIGWFGASQVWVKPWAIANYVLTYDAGATEKPLAFRQREATSRQGLRVEATLRAFPLVAEYQVAEYGVGVWNRLVASVLYFANATYADPTIA
jgi:hypothetical protein